VHTVLVCADCGVALEVPDPNPRPTVQRQLPPAAELALVATGVPREMERIALGLQERGISSRIDNHPAGRGVAIYVLPEDAGFAARVVRDLVFPQQDDELQSSSPGTELEACPACGAAVSDTDAACADCGLAFVAGEDPG
jgi:hypothetical protein